MNKFNMDAFPTMVKEQIGADIMEAITAGKLLGSANAEEQIGALACSLVLESHCVKCMPFVEYKKLTSWRVMG